MNWNAIWGVLGGIVFIIYVVGTIYQFINWDNEYWKLVMNITFAIAGLSCFYELEKKQWGWWTNDGLRRNTNVSRVAG